MRYILLTFSLLCFSLPAEAEEASPHVSVKIRTEMRGLIYNMCRGGGNAYELEAEYADQRDENCVTETYKKLLEIQQRANSFRAAEMQLHKLSRNQPTSPRLRKNYEAAFQRSLYIDYCIEKNEQRKPEATVGQCGYVDNRVLTGTWRGLAGPLAIHVNISGGGNPGSTEDAVKIFEENITLPAKTENVRYELTHNGFNCDGIHCEISNLIVPYRDGKLIGFARFNVRYTLTIENDMVTHIETVVGGAGL